VLSPEAEEVYKHLNQEAENSKTERMLLKSINQKIELIKQNIHYGNPIAKSLIPEEYKKKYGGIIRHKRIEYAKDNFIIYNTNGRDIHLSFSLIPIEFKLKDERIEDFSFCLLFRHSSYRDLEKIIRKVENQLELFQK